MPIQPPALPVAGSLRKQPAAPPYPSVRSTSSFYWAVTPRRQPGAPAVLKKTAPARGTRTGAWGAQNHGGSIGALREHEKRNTVGLTSAYCDTVEAS
jgi:hypothetical protein